MENNHIKALIPMECPHCHQPIMIEMTNTAPDLTGAYTPEMLQSAKKDALALIEKLGLPLEETADTIKWIKDENTIFAPSDIPEIIKNIQIREDK